LDSFIIWLEWIGESLTLIIMLFALAGMIIPIFPGTIIILIVALIYGIASGFGTIGVVVSVIDEGLPEGLNRDTNGGSCGDTNEFR